MGGDGPEVAVVAREIVSRWEHARHFELYDDVVPVLAAEAARAEARACLQRSRDLDAFVRHFGIEVDAWISSGSHGKVKPSPLIFAAALELLEVEAANAVMVGDSLEDDVEGAQACGMRAILIDRAGRFPEHAGRIESLPRLPPPSAASAGGRAPHRPRESAPAPAWRTRARRPRGRRTAPCRQDSLGVEAFGGELGHETRGPFVVAGSGRAVVDLDTHGKSLLFASVQTSPAIEHATPEEIEAVRRLFCEYQESLGVVALLPGLRPRARGATR